MNLSNIVSGLVAGVVVIAGAVLIMGVGQDGRDGMDGTPGVGAFPGNDIYQDVNIQGDLNYQYDILSISSTSASIPASLSGATIAVEAASGTTMVLPPIQEGLNYRFVIATAFDTANVIVDSAEGDNIDGTLIVAGAVVDCRGEDQLNFVNDGEAVGDYVEVAALSGQWVIVDSGVLTSAKLTCTDPS